MASVGHIAVGMAAARMYRLGRVPQWSPITLWSALSLLPDVDVVGFSLGVEYGDPWGHRGATHSLAFSVAIGLAVGVAARWFKRPGLRTALIAGVVLASHGLLDTMTDGGLGCALFWPFDLTRYFAPWRPLPVAPIGLGFFSAVGGIIALTELVLFSPLLRFALRSRRLYVRVTALFTASWAVSVWLIASGDPAREAIVGFLLREDTVFATGYSEKAFGSIAAGEPEREIRRRLGEPLKESWFYTQKNLGFQPAITRSAASLKDECLLVRFEAGSVAKAHDIDACGTLGIETGMSPRDVNQRLGPPPESCLQYSRSPGDGFFRLRVVCFENATVATVIREWQR